jgi:hypothetical protein
MTLDAKWDKKFASSAGLGGSMAEARAKCMRDGLWIDIKISKMRKKATLALIVKNNSLPLHSFVMSTKTENSDSEKEGS